MLVPGEQYVRIDLSTMFGNAEERKAATSTLLRFAIDLWPQDLFYPYPNVIDTAVVLFDLTATDGLIEPRRLPHQGKAIWMTHFRANTGLNGKAIHQVAENAQWQGANRAATRRIDHHYVRAARTEAFRTFTEDRIVSPLFRIVTQPSGLPQDRIAAEALQRRLAAMYGATLPIDPPDTAAGAANSFVVGRGPAIAFGIVDERDLEHVGKLGFVIRARDGRVALAGNSPEGTLQAVLRYLEDHGARIGVPGILEHLPVRENTFLHEMLLLDFPFFEDRVPCESYSKAGSDRNSPSPRRHSADEASRARTLSELIKSEARRLAAKSEPRRLALKPDSLFTCVVASRLLWNPFLDTSQVIRDYSERMK
jgi:hypothetical protein